MVDRLRYAPVRATRSRHRDANPGSGNPVVQLARVYPGVPGAMHGVRRNWRVCVSKGSGDADPPDTPDTSDLRKRPRRRGVRRIQQDSVCRIPDGVKQKSTLPKSALPTPPVLSVSRPLSRSVDVCQPLAPLSPERGASVPVDRVWLKKVGTCASRSGRPVIGFGSSPSHTPRRRGQARPGGFGAPTRGTSFRARA